MYGTAGFILTPNWALGNYGHVGCLMRLNVNKYPPTTYEYMREPCACMCASSYSKVWLDRASLRFFVHPPWSQGVNFDAPITFCACSTQKVPQTKKRSHMQFPIALELFTQTLLIGSINRRDVTSLYKNLVKIKKTNFLRAAIQEPKFCVDRKQATSVAMGKVLTST